MGVIHVGGSMAKKLYSIPAYDGSTGRRIRKLVAENPKKGRSALRFAQYHTGMTIQEYVQACEALGIPNHALFDITWDTDPKRRFIELYD
jgi:hypothetical protein